MVDLPPESESRKTSANSQLTPERRALIIEDLKAESEECEPSDFVDLERPEELLLPSSLIERVKQVADSSLPMRIPIEEKVMALIDAEMFRFEAANEELTSILENIFENSKGTQEPDLDLKVLKSVNMAFCWMRLVKRCEVSQWNRELIQEIISFEINRFFARLQPLQEQQDPLQAVIENPDNLRLLIALGAYVGMSERLDLPNSATLRHRFNALLETLHNVPEGS